ncbi:hypothetical protein LSAT2_000103 [Lamellibrachia satsuma]|nr:hypothetical protein LSAT2_000103 [Lamellibrachia satsuma]
MRGYSQDRNFSPKAVILGLTFAEKPVFDKRTRLMLSAPRTLRHSAMMLRILAALQCSIEKCGTLKGPAKVQCTNRTCQRGQHRRSADMEGARSKRWQYSDPVEVCISAKCPGQTGAVFYQCVYEECIMKGLRSGEE